MIPNEEHCLLLLKKNNTPKKVIEHSQKVTQLVKKLSSRMKVKRRIVIAGAMLHDIGKSKTRGAKHGFIGGRILKNEGINEKIIKITERHVGVGINKKEASQLGLPPRNFIPQTPEEKIVCYADKLIIGNYTAKPEEAKIKFASQLPPNHPALKRWDKFMQEMKRTLGKPPSFINQNEQKW